MSNEDAYIMALLFCAGSTTISIANTVFGHNAKDSLPWYAFGAALVVAAFMWPL